MCRSVDLTAQDLNSLWAVGSMERHVTAMAIDWLQRSRDGQRWAGTGLTTEASALDRRGLRR